MKLSINNRKIFRKLKNMLKLNNTFLSNNRAKKKSKEKWEILEINENDTIYPILRDANNVMLRVKFRAVNAYIFLKKSQINNLIILLKKQKRGTN